MLSSPLLIARILIYNDLHRCATFVIPEPHGEQDQLLVDCCR